MFKVLILFFFVYAAPVTRAVPNADLVCGKWMSSDKNLVIRIFKEGNVFKAKMVWFKNDDTSKAMDEWTDKHNPNPALRERKLIGMDILENMAYVPKTNSWEYGKVYDAKSGREWDASARIDKSGELKVTGYWHLKFIGRSMSFTRVAE